MGDIPLDPMGGAFFHGRAVTTFDYPASVGMGVSLWRVLESFTLYLNAHQTYWVTIPVGYLTDGASVPRAFWGVLDRWDWYSAAVIIHDFLCEYLQVMSPDGLVSITRAQCDQILDVAMAALEPQMGFSDDVSDARATIYNAVCFYRTVSGVDKPTNNPRKRAYEAAWTA